MNSLTREEEDEIFAKRLRSVRISAEYGDSNDIMWACDAVALGAGLSGFDSPWGFTVVSHDRLEELRKKAGEP